MANTIAAPSQLDNINNVNSPLTAVNRIHSTIKVNNATAGIGESNIIEYTVYDTQNHSMPGVYLGFSASGNAVLGESLGVTDRHGRFSLSITDGRPESVTINAYAVNLPEIRNQANVNFAQSQQQPYRLSIAIQRNNALADNSDFNKLIATLSNTTTGVGIPNVYLVVSVDNPAFHDPLVPTGPFGIAEIPFTSLTAGNVTVRISMQDNAAVYIEETITFRQSGSGELGTHRVHLSRWEGIATFLGPYQIEKNHRYRIVSNRVATDYGYCQLGHTFNQSSQTCVLGGLNQVIFPTNNLFDAVAQVSGPGRDLVSDRCNYYSPESNSGEALITVYDEGIYAGPSAADSAGAVAPTEADVLVAPPVVGVTTVSNAAPGVEPTKDQE